MLNLNYNIIGSIKQEFKATNQYQIRTDPYSASIVLAIPGNLFKNGLDQNQFDMQNSFDDISAYVRGNGSKDGDNLQILLSSSLNPNSASFYATSSYVKFSSPQDRYEESLYFAGESSLVVNKIWPSKQGGNLSFSSSFVIETYAGFIATASYDPATTNFQPNRIFAYKYDPGDPSSSQYFFETWGGNNGASTVSGSLAFYYDFDGPIGPSEGAILGNFSNPTGNYTWNHYAVSYESNSRKLYSFINGVAQKEVSIPSDIEFINDTAELLQVFGAVDAQWAQGSYSGSQAVFQDFRMYNGTNKGYTLEGFVPPPSIVRWG
jgi:hypothetical protein